MKEMLAEQRGRVSGEAEVEGLKIKSNTERELSVFFPFDIFFFSSLIIN